MDMEDNKRLGKALISLGKGNFAALSEITSLMQKLFYTIANSYYRSKADVEDAVQDLYLTLCKKAKDFKRNENAKGWLVRVFNNQLLSKKRKELRENEALGEYARTRANTAVDEEYLEKYLFLKETKDNLTEEEWKLFEYSQWYGYTIREIAKLTHKSKGAVEYQLNKLKEKIDLIALKREK